MGNGNFCLVWYPEARREFSVFKEMVHCVRFQVGTDLDFEGKPFHFATYLGCDLFPTADGRPIRHYSATTGA